VLAKFAQHRLTQAIGIEFAGFCTLDNSFDDSFTNKIASVAKLESCASLFECDAHDPLGLAIEFWTVQKLRDGHDLATSGPRGLARPMNSIQAAMSVGLTCSITKRYLRPRVSVAHQQSRSSSHP